MATDIHQLLNYCTTHPDATIHFHASDMVLWTQSDASYLTAPQGRSRAAGYSFLSSRPHSLPTANDPTPPNNRPVHVLCQILHHVVSSATEAELGTLFLNAQDICPICMALDELGHPQPATPLQTDNNTASGIINYTIKQHSSKSVDMRFYWLCDHSRQGQFHVFWWPGITNWANYFSKHHAPAHHQAMHPTYLLPNPPAACCFSALMGSSVYPGEGVLIPANTQSHGLHSSHHAGTSAASGIGQVD